jgi:hypothetical protein
MGNEVADWKVTENELTFTLRLPRITEGKVSVALPWPKVTIFCDDNLVEFTRDTNGVFEFPVVVPGFSRIRICRE